MKALWWGEMGWAVWHKRLERGTFRPGEHHASISPVELSMILEWIVAQGIRRLPRFHIERNRSIASRCAKLPAIIGVSRYIDARAEADYHVTPDDGFRRDRECRHRSATLPQPVAGIRTQARARTTGLAQAPDVRQLQREATTSSSGHDSGGSLRWRSGRDALLDRGRFNPRAQGRTQVGTRTRASSRRTSGRRDSLGRLRRRKDLRGLRHRTGPHRRRCARRIPGHAARR